MKSKSPIIVIAGPTASGKSNIAISLAKEIGGYILNADSRQVYREMKIGSAQPIPDSIEGDIWYIDGVRHLLYGYRGLENPIDISQYQEDVQRVLDREDGIPILVGGTGLYIDCIVQNYIIQNENIDTEKREYLLSLSVEELQKKINPKVLESMNRSDRMNPRRLIRVIEREQVENEKGEPLEHIYFVVDKSKEELKKRISLRIEDMFKNGLEEEVKDLFSRDDPSLSVFNTIGYQEFRGYFDKEKSLNEVKREIENHTNQYAKRQRTWFRRNKDAIWSDSLEKIIYDAKQFIKTS